MGIATVSRKKYKATPTNVPFNSVGTGWETKDLSAENEPPLEAADVYIAIENISNSADYQVGVASIEDGTAQLYSLSRAVGGGSSAILLKVSTDVFKQIRINAQSITDIRFTVTGFQDY